VNWAVVGKLTGADDAGADGADAGADGTTTGGVTGAPGVIVPPPPLPLHAENVAIAVMDNAIRVCFMRALFHRVMK
jgi:hypothetical protein